MRGGLGSVYRLIRLLSLDVAAGAATGGYYAQMLFKSRLPGYWIAFLFLSVWVIYTLDHLLDAWRLKETASTDRHRFHYRHFSMLTAICAILAPVLLTAAVWLLDWQSILFGFAMCILTGIHLLLVKLIGERTSPFLIKEMGVTIVYVAGLWGLPVIHRSIEPDFSSALILLQFFLLAFINLLEFSWFDYESDLRDKQTSFVIAVGKDKAQSIIRLLFILFGILHTTTWVLSGWNGFNFILLIMSILLMMLMLRPDSFRRHEKYRVIGDGAFLLPGLIAIQFL